MLCVARATQCVVMYSAVRLLQKQRKEKKMEYEKLKIRITFTEEVLGTAANDPKIHDEYIASKAPDAPSRSEEVKALGADAVIEKSMTVFPKLEDGTPFVWDYQIKGFFKDTCGALRKVKGSESSKVKAYKKEIDGLVFIEERKIPFQNFGEIGQCQRPLRGQTPQQELLLLCLRAILMRDGCCLWAFQNN